MSTALEYVEKARADFLSDTTGAETAGERKAYDAARQRMDAILDRMRQDEARTEKPSGTVLEQANEIIHGERLKHYGHPKVNFERIAKGWEQYFGHPVTMMDVASCMIILKVMRMTEGYHRDSVIDIGGYAALMAVVEGDDAL